MSKALTTVPDDVSTMRSLAGWRHPMNRRWPGSSSAIGKFAPASNRHVPAPSSRPGRLPRSASPSARSRRCAGRRPRAGTTRVAADRHVAESAPVSRVDGADRAASVPDVDALRLRVVPHLSASSPSATLLTTAGRRPHGTPRPPPFAITTCGGAGIGEIPWGSCGPVTLRRCWSVVISSTSRCCRSGPRRTAGCDLDSPPCDRCAPLPPGAACSSGRRAVDQPRMTTRSRTPQRRPSGASVATAIPSHTSVSPATHSSHPWSSVTT